MSTKSRNQLPTGTIPNGQRQNNAVMLYSILFSSEEDKINSGTLCTPYVALSAWVANVTITPRGITYAFGADMSEIL